MSRPELSVVLPSFGRQRQTERAVASALAQDVDLEIVVIDDGSPSPLELAGDARIRIVRFQQNQGAAAARNAGVAMAAADWIAFLDSDDAWPDGSLRPRLSQARAAADAHETIWVAGFVDTDATGRRLRSRLPRETDRIEDFASGCWACPGSTALLTREGWVRSGGQDENLRRLEDFEWLYRWGAGGGRLRVYPAIGAEISRGSRAAPDLVAAAAAQILFKHADVPTPLRRRMQSYLYLELGASRLAQRAWLGAGLALAQSWLLHPRMQPSLERFWL